MSASVTYREQSPQCSDPLRNIASSGLCWFSKTLPVAVGILIFMGALVTSNDAGLAVPDWPTTYGENMFLFPPSKWIGGIFYEHVHRLIASGVGLLTVILTVWTALVDHRPAVRRLTFAALAIVICQGGLGGLTVLMRLPDAVSTAHGVLGQTFFIVSLIIAFLHSREYAQALKSPLTYNRRVFGWACGAVAAVYLQLIIGAWMRHTSSGLAVLDFPQMGGSWLPLPLDSVTTGANTLRAAIHLPPVGASQVVYHLLHRFGALAVVAIVGAMIAAAAPMGGLVRKTAWRVGIVLCVQFGLGVAAVLSVRSPLITSLHVLIGAVLLAMTVLTALRILTAPAAR